MPLCDSAAIPCPLSFRLLQLVWFSVIVLVDLFASRLRSRMALLLPSPLWLVRSIRVLLVRLDS